VAATHPGDGPDLISAISTARRPRVGYTQNRRLSSVMLPEGAQRAVPVAIWDAQLGFALWLCVDEKFDTLFSLRRGGDGSLGTFIFVRAHLPYRVIAVLSSSTNVAAIGNTRPRRVARKSRACRSGGSISGSAIMSPGGITALPGVRN
jgi:hypothetical protein